MVSAAFEAFELLICQLQSLNTDSPIEFLSLKDLLENQSTVLGLPQRFSSELLSRSNQLFSKELPFLSYSNWLSKEPENALMPLAAAEWSYASSCPETMQDFYSNYLFMATTSGVASGCGYEDALVHGVTELIERDALAGFLVRHCFNRKVATALDRATLPESAREITERIEMNHQCQIECFRMPNRFGLPAYISVCDQQTEPFISGKGASISHEHALLRSLLETEEMLEYFKRYGEEEHQKYTSACQQLAEWPALKPCIDIDFKRTNTKEAFHHPQDEQEPYGQNALTTLKTLLGQHNKKIWVNVVRAETPVVLRVYIEGIDEFFAIKDGVPVVPLNSSFE